jgi:CheY-like chemotaxis protein
VSAAARGPVLVVDDESAMRDALRRILETEGYQVEATLPLPRAQVLGTPIRFERLLEELERRCR